MQFALFFYVLAVYGQLTCAVRERKQVPECVDVSSIPEDCRSLPGSSLEDEGIADPSAFVERCCSVSCAQPLHDYFRECDKATGSSNATTFDFFCSSNSNGSSCALALFGNISFAETFTSACDETLCAEDECRTALKAASDNFGCCMYSFFAVIGEQTEATVVFTLCSIDRQDLCNGGVTDEPLQFFGASDGCDSLQETLPPQCQVDVDILIAIAFRNPDMFLTDFCNSDCGEAVYNYHLQCDKIRGSNDAAGIDFLCAQNDGSKSCAGFFSDPSVQTALFSRAGVCNDTSDKFCSDECSSILQQTSRTWGCCLYTYGALSDNITYTEGIVEQCKIPGNPHLCVGAFSGNPVAADPGDVKDGDATTVVSSGVLVIAVLILALFN